MLHATTDPAELAKFDAIAHRFWDEQGEFRPLHILNPVRTAFVAERCQLAGATVVDVGCGGGLLAESLAHAGARVTAIDLAPTMIDVARLHAAGAGLDIDYRLQSVEALAAEREGSFDVVTCMEMLEHVPDPSAVVAACARLVKPGGWVFFSTINRNPLSYLVAIVGAEHVLRLLPKGTHTYARFIKPAELTGMASRSGLALHQQRGLGYNPLTQRFRLHRFMGVGYLLATRSGA